MGYLPDGQWVQTQQYGWVWMPYSDAYAYLPPGGVGEPLEYVFYPSVGWAWVSAPWMWGYGPAPAFGRRGPDRFAWYEHGWWREPRRWSYRPAPEPERHAARGVRPAPVLTRPAPAAPRQQPTVQGRPGGERGRAAPRPEGRARGDERRRRDNDRDGDGR
jgi:hypothetical protein